MKGIQMLPSSDDPRWRAIVTGAQPYQPNQMSAQMLMTRLTMSVQQDPSPDNVARRAQELHAFCTKFEKLLAKDLGHLFGATV